MTYADIVDLIESTFDRKDPRDFRLTNGEVADGDISVSGVLAGVEVLVTIRARFVEGPALEYTVHAEDQENSAELPPAATGPSLEAAVAAYPWTAAAEALDQGGFQASRMSKGSSF